MNKIKELKSFLELKGCKEEFEKNMEAVTIDYAYLRNPLVDNRDCITCAFSWAGTVQGYDFWSEIEGAWHTILEWEDYSNEFKIGDKVHYQPKHASPDEWENGIVKEIPKHTESEVRVVYHCAGDWDNYQDYTSILTAISDLKIGWR